MPTKYVHFTDEQKEQARQTDLCELLRSQGEKLKRSGSEYEWKDGSQKVTIRGNLWFHQYDQQGGDAIDFVRRFYNKDYPEAVEYLLGGRNGTLAVSTPIERTMPKPFVLPQRNDNMRRVYAYLLSRRGLDRDVVYAFAHRQMIYESAQYHNAVFVGFDQDGVPRHANMRGTGSESTFKGNADSSIPEYSFHWTGRSKYLLLFEAPIDMLSFISMHKKNWQQHSYLAQLHFCILVFLTSRSVDVDYIVPPAYNRADHLSSAPAAFYFYLVFLVFQPRNFFLTVRAIPGVNNPIQHRRTPLLLFLRKRNKYFNLIQLIAGHTPCGDILHLLRNLSATFAFHPSVCLF